MALKIAVVWKKQRKDAESTSITAANEDDVTDTESAGTDPQALASDKTPRLSSIFHEWYDGSK